MAGESRARGPRPHLRAGRRARRRAGHHALWAHLPGFRGFRPPADVLRYDNMAAGSRDGREIMTPAGRFVTVSCRTSPLARGETITPAGRQARLCAEGRGSAYARAA